MSGVSFNPATDIPSMEGRVVLITGANSGLGRQSALELARHRPAKLWMAARDAQKGREAVAHVTSEVPGVSAVFLELDLSSFESIKSAARTVLAASPRLDILMLNAGLMGCPPRLTQEGYEIQMGTNHLGHALLLQLLTSLLERTAVAAAPSQHMRVVSMASSAWKYAGPEKIQFETLTALEGVSPVNRYVQSKAANMLYAQAWAQHRAKVGVDIVSIDPGEVATALFQREPGDSQMVHLQTEVAPKLCKPVAEGVKNQLWAATADGVVSGQHYEPVGVRTEPTGLQLDTALVQELWEWTQKQLKGQTL